jgi:hypothetical protein
VPFRHAKLTIALALLAPACLPAPAQAVPRRALVVFAHGVTAKRLASVPGASVGLLGATQGRYERLQAVLDMSQGTRTSFNAYDPVDLPVIGIGRGRIENWRAVVRRARGAPAEVVPGLLGSALRGRAAWVGPPDPEAIVAADRAGRFETARSVAGALRDHELVVTEVRGIGAVRRLAAARPPGALLVAIAALPPSAHSAQLLPIATVGLGGGRELTTRTTRIDGLVTGIDLAPTVLRWLGRPVPREMVGEPMRANGREDLGALRRLEARLRVVSARRLPTLAWLGVLWLAVALALRSRRALRIGGLAVLWMLPSLLAFGAFAPARAVEEIGVGALALALGALTDALVPWPRAPLVPAVVTVVAYVADLAAGSPLIVRSLFGPNPLFGARFYGIGNELEATLPVVVLVGVAAALGDRERSRTTALAFAAAGVVLGAALGSGRLGADVGGVITVGAGTAVAVALAAPGRVTTRRVALVLAAPVAAVIALAGLDLATGGDSHFTRSVLRAGDHAALGDAIVRRYQLAFRVLERPVMLVLAPLALLAIAVAIRRRDALLAGIPGAPLWGAALAGAAAAGLAGALFNDSGPLLLVFSVFVAAWTAVYLRAGVGEGG